MAVQQICPECCETGILSIANVFRDYCDCDTGRDLKSIASNEPMELDDDAEDAPQFCPCCGGSGWFEDDVPGGYILCPERCAARARLEVA